MRASFGTPQRRRRQWDANDFGTEPFAGDPRDEPIRFEVSRFAHPVDREIAEIRRGNQDLELLLEQQVNPSTPV